MNDSTKIPERLSALLKLFDSVTDMDERAALLVSYADRFKSVPPEISSRPFPEEHRVSICESQAYVWGVPDGEGRLTFYFAVENPSGISAKALASILASTTLGARPEEIVNLQSDIVERLFRKDMSMGKGMGLMGMVEMMRAIAASYVARPAKASA